MRWRPHWSSLSAIVREGPAEKRCRLGLYSCLDVAVSSLVQTGQDVLSCCNQQEKMFIIKTKLNLFFFFKQHFYLCSQLCFKDTLITAVDLHSQLFLNSAAGTALFFFLVKLNKNKRWLKNNQPSNTITVGRCPEQPQSDLLVTEQLNWSNWG